MLPALSAERGDPASSSARRWVATLPGHSPRGKKDEGWSPPSTAPTQGYLSARWLAASHKDESYVS